MSENKKMGDGDDLSDADLEALFAAEVAKQKKPPPPAPAAKPPPPPPPPPPPAAEAEPSEEDLEAMFAAEVAKETKKEKVKVKSITLPDMNAPLPAQRDSVDAEDVNLDMILDIPVDIQVEVGHTRITVQEILRLDVGSVVELDRVAGQPADILANGKLVGKGDVVVVNENFGIRITKLVGLEERLNSI